MLQTIYLIAEVHRHNLGFVVVISRFCSLYPWKVNQLAGSGGHAELLVLQVSYFFTQ